MNGDAPRGQAAPGTLPPAGASLLPTELTLALVTLTVVLGMARLFDGLDYLPTVVVVAGAGHLVAALARRARFGMLLSLLLSVVTVVLAITWLEYPDTTTWLLPTGRTWDAVTDDLGQAWDAFAVVKAPTEALPGFVVGAAVAGWMVATLSDLAAFRARSAAEALAPAASMFVFTAMLGTDDHRLVSTAAVIAASILFVLAFRIAFPPPGSVPIGETARRRAPALTRVGGGLAVASLALGLMAGPLLPGADAAPVVDWKELDGGGGSGPRITLSPLVDSRGRLVNQSSTVVFTVEADQPTFWRTTALDRFDGSVWGSNNNYEVSGRELVAADQPAEGQVINQRFTIEGLADIWLPAAYTPVRLDGASARWDDESSTLIVRDAATEPGLTYEVTSLSPIGAVDRDTLLSASDVVPFEIQNRYTQLPADFDPRITRLAAEITDPWPTAFEKALALQNWFLDNFEYSLDVSTGHDGTRMARFLFDERIGYCEQFAGTYAAMARAVGLPARVATGFTPGELIDGEYVVRGEHYHAWPEIWIDGQWVYFEPTPGRGAPGAVGYTGVAEQQATPTDDSSETTAPSDTTPLGALEPNFPIEEFGDLGGGAGASDDGGSGLPTWFVRAVQGLAVLAVAALVWAAAMPLLRLLRRRRRRARAATPADRVEAAWSDLSESLSAAGVVSDPAETPREYARRVHASTHLDRERLARLAALITEARYAAAAPTAGGRDPAGDEARELVRRLEADLAASADRRERFLRRIDPRPMMRS